MSEHMSSSSDAQQAFTKFSDCACAGDFEGMRELVAADMDMSQLSSTGETILETVLCSLPYSPEAQKYAVDREMIRLGADPSQLNTDGSGPLFMAVLNMDTEMLRILINAGADPNLERMDTS